MSSAHMESSPREEGNMPPLDVYLNDSTFANQLGGMVRKACIAAGKPELVEDALQEAWAVCVERSREFDPSLGVSFVNFVRPHVRWAALHYCKNNSGAFTIPDRMWRNRHRNGADDLNAAIHPTSLNEDNTESKGEAPCQIPDGGCLRGVRLGRLSRESPLWRKFEYEHLRALVRRLEPHEQKMVARYGDGLGCADIAREMGVTRQRVHQILQRAFAKIRDWWEVPTFGVPSSQIRKENLSCVQQ